jgi:PAS domain S-box-containing protein
MPEKSDRLSTTSQAPVVTTLQQETQESPEQPSLIKTDSIELETKKKAFLNNEERYRLLMEVNSQLTWDTDADGQVISEQPGWSAFTGQAYEEYKGWGWLNAVHPDDQHQSKQTWADALAKRCLCAGEHRLRRHDGEYRYMSIRAVPILEPDGSIREWIGIHTDITETKQVQEARDRALAEAEAARAELHRVFMQAPAAISTSRGSNHVTETANPLYLQLIGNRDVIGKTASEAFPELEAQGFVQLLDQVYITGEPFIGNEMRAVFDRNGDGVQEESFWNFVYQPLVDAEGKVYGIMTHAVEVTEQVRTRQEIEKKAEELAHLTQALKRSNQELDQFAYVTSHDLKAPLRAIANLSEWLEEDLADKINDDSREHLHLMRKRVHRMAALIDGILQYSRAGRLQQVETVNVSTLLGDLIELLAPPPGISIVVEPGMPTLKTEKIPLEQVLMNLMSNAIKYAQGTDTCIQVSVRDGGNTTSLPFKTMVPELHRSFTIRSGASSKGWKLEIKLKERVLVSPSLKKLLRVEVARYGWSQSLVREQPSALHGLKLPQLHFD